MGGEGKVRKRSGKDRVNGKGRRNWKGMRESRREEVVKEEAGEVEVMGQ